MRVLENLVNIELVKIVFRILLVVVIILVAGIGYVFFSFQVTTPKDLGITYSQADLQSGRTKSQIIYETLNEGLPNGSTWITSGSREVDTTFSSSELTAIMNNKPGIYYPYKDVQVKFNADGTAEISCAVEKSRIPTYAATFGTPQEVVDLAMAFMPENPVFYLKGRATLVNNEVGVFEPMRFEVGRLPLPMNLILANNPNFSNKAYAMDLNELLNTISSVSDKRSLIIGFINEKIAGVEGFYAKDAHIEEDKLVYEGTLPETESTVR